MSRTYTHVDGATIMINSLRIRRWRDIVLYSVISATVAITIAPLLHGFAGAWVLGRPLVAQAAISILALSAIAALGWGRWRGCFEVRHWPRYPPHLISVALGLFMLLLAGLGGSQSKLSADAGTYSGSDSTAGLLTRISVFVLGAVVLWLTDRALNASAAARVRQSDEVPSLVLRHADTPPEPWVISWIADDSPICDPSNDKFGHAHVANRIAGRLNSNDYGSVVLLGAIGSGKSSIGELVQTRLLGRNQICFQRISVWPFAFSESAIEGILERVVDCLCTRVDTLAISGVPDAYAKLITAGAPGIGGAFGAAKSQGDPGDLLNRIDHVASEAGLIVVLWIEDLERFAPNEGENHPRQLSQIYSLLYELQTRSSIRVIIATATIREHVDAAKIARYIDHVPRLDPCTAWKLISDFRNTCLSTRVRWVDSVRVVTRAQAATIATDPRKFRIGGKAGQDEALALATDNPRALKLGLRRAHEAWSVLRGEIDFDDVLAISILQAAAPQVYAFINEHIDRFRDGPPMRISAPNQKDEDQDASFQSELNRVIASATGEGQRNAWRSLIEFIFPTMSRNSTAAHNRPQGLASKEPRDYWARFTAQAAVDESESDQAVLSAIDAWEGNADRRLLEHLETAGQAGAAAVFGNKLSEARVYDCLRAVCGRLAASSSPDTQAIIERLGVVRRMMYGRHPDLSQLSQTAVDSIRDSGAQDLRVAVAVLRVFVYDADTWFLGQFNGAFREQIKSAAREALIESCNIRNVDDPDRRFSGLGPIDFYQLVRMSTVGFGVNMESPPFEDWPRVGEALTEAVEREPDVYGPHILLFLTTQPEWGGGGGSEWQCSVKLRALNTMFDSARVCAALGGPAEYPSWPTELQIRLSVLRQHISSRRHH